MEDAASHMVVVVGDVAEDQDVADELNQGAKDARERCTGQKVFSVLALARIFLQIQRQSFFVASLQSSTLLLYRYGI